MSPATSGRELLRVENLKVYYPLRRTLEEILAGVRRFLRAVDGVSFSILEGESLALVGESGSGKTTVARAIVGLVEPTEGRITYNGYDVAAFRGRELAMFRRSVQMVFQDPSVSLNPRMRVGDQVKFPLDVNKIGSKEERRQIVLETLKRVGLVPPEDFYNRYPHQLSGGQRQRVAIARALVLRPRLLIADEPISNIDVSARAQILSLLKELREEMGLTLLYITHDLSSAWAVADKVAVMYLGKILEYGRVDDVFTNPLHPYTRALLSSVPSLSPEQKLRKKLLLSGEVPNAINIPSGCRLHPRCPFASQKCRVEEPSLLDAGNGHLVACHLYG
ncbi:ABC transporter ATP-binding protein [Infirmifilum lucidum]|uniref:ABC transporter ATP-binding protein n=1 Tax=Infirmifilum lucidum TaxID=2776706 RepID=A0A7L9FGJ0_9CREN|nr:ABC transporter ATP-binding protein [Infirmifilum lucidum]QOJ78938.1 ABC transporter ATP-binding protein [Infirmifilum lucidum]